MKSTDPLPEHCHYARLTDMLDFSRIDFNKAISLNPKQNIDFETQWELVKLGEMAEIVAGQSPKSEFYNQNQEGLPFYQGKKEFGDIYLSAPTIWTEQITKKSIRNDILMSVRAPVGNVNINPYEEICIGRGLAAIRARENKVLQYYLFSVLDINQALITGHKGMSVDSISTSDELPDIKIPLPPLEVQQQIVDECEAVDQETYEDRQTITAVKQRIEEKVNRLWSESIKDKLDNVIRINTKSYNPTLNLDKEFIYIDIDSVGKANGVIDYSKRLTGKNAPSRARRIAKNGSTIISTVRPYLKGFAFVDTDDIDDCVFSTGFAVLESKSPHSLL